MLIVCRDVQDLNFVGVKVMLKNIFHVELCLVFIFILHKINI